VQSAIAKNSKGCNAPGDAVFFLPQDNPRVLEVALNNRFGVVKNVTLDSKLRRLAFSIVSI
jgi:hypothetical protein